MDRQERLLQVKATHGAPEEWYRLYDSTPIGSVPGPADCYAAPPSQQALARIPNIKATRKKSILSHFYSKVEGKFQCQVLDESGVKCPHEIGSRSGGSGRRNHIMSKHSDIYDALREFRFSAPVQNQPSA
jgi:hypothetical protein